LIAARLVPDTENDFVFIGSFSVIAAVLSGFMNNVGALALLMPVAIQAAAKSGRSPALILMPLSFASILGGLFTLIGTPPNIIIASFREKSAGEPFGMFAFSPVGGVIAIVGVIFVALVGWKLIPKERLKRKKDQEVFDIEGYVAEARVPKDSTFIGQQLKDVADEIEAHGARVIGKIRKDYRISSDRRRRVDQDDLIVFEADPEAMSKIAADLNLDLVSDGKPIDDLTSNDVALVEAVVAPGSSLIRKTTDQIPFRRRYRVNLLAVSRQGTPNRTRLSDHRFEAGDVILLHGDRDHFPNVVTRMGCLPLAERDLQLAAPSRALLAGGMFLAAILLTAFGLLSAPVAFGGAILGMILTSIVTLDEAYDAIDWPIIVLLAALIPVGGALESTGTTKLMASGIAEFGASLSPVVILVVVMIVTMTLSDIINNAATAVVMAPISVEIAKQLGVNSDPFLMAVAIGASCAFLTPIGHQNNTLVMGPGGYRFGDYWRVGLPLEAIIVLISVPMLLLVFPL
jgi:di/tricarboxylate transporter